MAGVVAESTIGATEPIIKDEAYWAPVEPRKWPYRIHHAHRLPAVGDKYVECGPARADERKRDIDNRQRHKPTRRHETILCLIFSVPVAFVARAHCELARDIPAD